MELQTNVKTGDLKINAPEPSEVVTKVEEKKVEPELVTRVSQVKVEPTAEKTVTEPEFDFKEIEKIQDPAAKDYALKAYKSFQKGFNTKFQELAEIRKSYEKKATETSTWTPERIQTLLNDPNFVNAAQSIVKGQNPTGSGLTDEEYSALSDRDKQRLQNLEVKLQQMEQVNWHAIKTQQDSQLKSKYANYQPEAVDILTSDMLTGKYQATREDIWKAYDYDKAVRRAYELGIQDKQLQQQEKVESTSAEGTTAVRSESTLEPEKNESNLNFFRRLVLDNMKKAKTEQIRK